MVGVVDEKRSVDETYDSLVEITRREIQKGGYTYPLTTKFYHVGTIARPHRFHICTRWGEDMFVYLDEHEVVDYERRFLGILKFPRIAKLERVVSVKRSEDFALAERLIESFEIETGQKFTLHKNYWEE